MFISLCLAFFVCDCCFWWELTVNLSVGMIFGTENDDTPSISWDWTRHALLVRPHFASQKFSFAHYFSINCMIVVPKPLPNCHISPSWTYPCYQNHLLHRRLPTAAAREEDLNKEARWKLSNAFQVRENVSGRTDFDYQGYRRNWCQQRNID